MLIDYLLAEPKVEASQAVVDGYSTEKFTIALVVAIFVSLVVGFLCGLVFSRRCKLEDYSGGFNGAPYLEQRRLSRLNETMTAHQNIEPSKMNNFIDNQTVKMANEKNSNAVTTLDMKPVQKVKKTYVWTWRILHQQHHQQQPQHPQSDRFEFWLLILFYFSESLFVPTPSIHVLHDSEGTQHSIKEWPTKEKKTELFMKDGNNNG